MASSTVLPLSHSVARLLDAMALPQPKVLNFASSIRPVTGSTLICSFMTSELLLVMTCHGAGGQAFLSASACHHAGRTVSSLASAARLCVQSLRGQPRLPCKLSLLQHFYQSVCQSASSGYTGSKSSSSQTSFAIWLQRPALDRVEVVNLLE